MRRLLGKTVEPGITERDIQSLSDRFRAPLRSYLAKRLPPHADIDDYVQTVFLRLVQRDDLQSIENIDGYIFQTAANLIRDERRRSMARRGDDTVEYDEAKHGHASFSPERVLLGKDRLETVARALEAMPERTRTVFILKRFETMRYGEIARRLDISVSAVEKHMAKAIARLDAALDQEDR